MLIQFRVENHRSLRDEQTLSLVASPSDARNADSDGDEAPAKRPTREDLVPVAAIYGANASGKSNVLAALKFMKSAILLSQRRWEVDETPHDPFRLSPAAIQSSSLYEVDISVRGVRHRYGFRLSRSRINEEWLYHWPRGRKATLFERDEDSFSFGKTLHGENETIRGLTRPNSLFLSAAAQNNHLLLLPVFRAFSRWHFTSRHRGGLSRVLVSPAQIFAHRLQSQAIGFDDEKAAVLRLLREADTGILDVRADPRDEDQRNPASARRAAISFRHRSEADVDHPWLPLEAESAGTIALLELAPLIVGALRDGTLLCIDELESSLHPSLAYKILSLFNNAISNPKRAQLIFSTHDTNLLGTVAGEKALRRDQIWFTEKDNVGATHLYPLTDFHPRKEENLERGYLQGRYGAIPVLGELVVMPEEEQT